MLVALLGVPSGPTQVIDADIATVSGAADKVLRVSGRPPYLLHLEFVAGHDAALLPGKLHVRNALLEDRHDLAVCSAAIVLHPAADSPRLSGLYERLLPSKGTYRSFRYEVVRVWQLDPEMLLTGGMGLLPLAPISAVTEADLPGIIQRMARRLDERALRRQAPLVWGAAYILLGLRYSPALAAQLFGGVLTMRESSTYQAILEEGRGEGAVAEARKVLRLQGDEAFGAPDARTAALIEGLTDLTRLEGMLRRVRTAASWQEVLGSPPPSRRTGRRR